MTGRPSRRCWTPATTGFLLAQEGYFDNLAQLPLAAFSYALDPTSLCAARASYSVVVEVTLQLAGFDAAPSRGLDRFRFDRVGRAVAAALASGSRR